MTAATIGAATRPRTVNPATIALVIVGLAIVIFAPLVVYPIFLMKVMCFALFAAAFNLLIGYVGLLSFGHAAFFGGAAYITAYLAKNGFKLQTESLTLGKLSVPLHLNIALPPFTPELAIIAGTIFAAILGVIVGYLAIRRQGIYFSMITLALAQMFSFFCLQAPFTGGEDGIQNVPRGRLFGIVDLHDPVAMYVLVACIFVFGFFAIWRIIHSPFGNILKSIRENEQRAISLGYRVERYKLAAFVMSATLAGLAGSTKSLVFQLASLTDVTWQMSGEVILMTLVGGIGTLVGPTLGALIVSFLEVYGERLPAIVLGGLARVLEPVIGSGSATSLEAWAAGTNFSVPVLLGIIFVVCVLVFRRGIVGEFNALARRMGLAS
jgi:branched-chain amino acid transport system permease protein